MTPYLVVILFTTLHVPGWVNGGLGSHDVQDSSSGGSSTNKQYLPPTSTNNVQPSHDKWASQGYKLPIAIPHVLPDGNIADTPEVTAARCSHLAAINNAQANNHDMDDGEYNPHKYGDDHYGVVSHKEDLGKTILFYQSLASSHHDDDKEDMKVMLQAGHSDVKLFDNAGYTLSAWKSSNDDTAGYSYGAPAEQNKPYYGPLAMLHVLATGYVEDAPEVAAAKKMHEIAVEKLKSQEKLWMVKDSHHQPWN